MIGESELILTPSKQIYHLNLRPEELADTVITVGDPDRVKEVSKYFDRVEFQTQHREFVTHTGYIGSKRITVLSSGIGPDNIDIVMNELDALVNIDFETREIRTEKKRLNIVRFGTSGSLQEDIPVDSLVASAYGIGLDNLLHFYQLSNSEDEKDLLANFTEHSQLQGSPIIPYAVQGSEKILKEFQNEFTTGITVTCPGFYAPQGRVVRAALQFENLVNRLSDFRWKDWRITNFEMETSAIFGLGRIFNHDCLAMNTIVANRKTKQFSKDGKKSVENLIVQSLKVIAGL